VAAIRTTIPPDGADAKNNPNRRKTYPKIGHHSIFIATGSVVPVVMSCSGSGISAGASGAAIVCSRFSSFWCCFAMSLSLFSLVSALVLRTGVRGFVDTLGFRCRPDMLWLFFITENSGASEIGGSRPGDAAQLPSRPLSEIRPPSVKTSIRYSPPTELYER